MSLENTLMRWVISLCMLMVAPHMATAQTPSPALLIVSRSDKPEGVLGIIDPVTGKIVGRVPAGIDSHGLAVSADGKIAYVANTNDHSKTRPDGDSISVIDVAARKEVRRVPIGEGARAHDIHVWGGKVYFTAHGSKAMGRYDPARNKVDHFGLGQGGPHMLAISKDMTTIFAANPDSNNVSVIEGVLAGPVLGHYDRPDWKVTLIPVGKEDEGIDVSPDGQEVWTANKAGGGASIIDVAKKVAQTIDLQTKHANRLKFTPDGKRVLLLDREIGELVVVDAATRKLIKKIKLPGDKPGETMGLGDVVVVPDGSRAYVNANAHGIGGHHYIAVIDLKTLAMTGRIDTGDMGSDYIAWAETK